MWRPRCHWRLQARASWGSIRLTADPLSPGRPDSPRRWSCGKSHITQSSVSTHSEKEVGKAEEQKGILLRVSSLYVSFTYILFQRT